MEGIVLLDDRDIYQPDVDVVSLREKTILCNCHPQYAAGPSRVRHDCLFSEW